MSSDASLSSGSNSTGNSQNLASSSDQLGGNMGLTPSQTSSTSERKRPKIKIVVDTTPKQPIISVMSPKGPRSARAADPLSPGGLRFRSPSPARTDIENVLTDLNFLRSPLSPRMDIIDEERVAGQDMDSFFKHAAELAALKSPLSPSKEVWDELDQTARSKPVSIWRLFSFSTTFDKFCIIGAAILSSIFGLAIPAMPVLYGLVFDAFAQRQNGVMDDDAFDQRISQLTLYFVLISIGAFVVGFSSNFLWLWSGHRQYNALLIAYYQNILRQNISWFDATDGEKAGENYFALGIISDAKAVYSAISQPMGIIIKSLSTSLGAAIVALYLNWKLALVFLATLPLAALVGMGLKRRMEAKIKEQQGLKSATTQRVADVINDIKTVFAYNGIEEERKHFDAFSEQRAAVVRSMLFWYSAFVSITNAFSYTTFALAYWFGGTLVSSGEATGANVLAIFLLSNFVVHSLFRALDRFAIVMEALGVSQKIFYVIDRIPPIDSTSTLGKIPDKCEGGIEFKDVTFSYPTRSESVTLGGFSVKIEAGKMTAFCGESGCGKSTIIQLLSRFYDVSSGEIKIDGTNVRKLSVRWLRSQIAIVSQEPFLYDMSLRENLLLADTKRNIAQEEIEEVCKIVQIHDFIDSLPQKYDTPVNDMGDNFSGGQRQRIVLARALLRNSKILILDEATSYLDVQSEAEIQKALTDHLKDRTVIVIAHRLQTIVNADKICFVENGSIVEEGTHKGLLAKGGKYSEMYEVTIKSPKLMSPKAFSPIRTINEFISGLMSPRIKSPPADPWRQPSHGKQPGRISQSTYAPSHVESSLGDDIDGINKIRKTLSYASYSRPAFTGAIVFGLLDGVVYPGYALIFSLTLSAYTNPNPDAVLADTIRNCLLYLALAVYRAFVGLMRGFCTLKAGAEISDSLRKETFAALFDKNIEWFDQPDHGAGPISSRTADDPATVHRVATSVLPNIAESFTISVLGLIAALVAGWKLALITLTCFPVLIIANRIEQRALFGFEKRVSKDYEKSEQFASTTIGSIRTVAAFNLQEYFVEKYGQVINGSLDKARLSALFSAVGAAIGESIIFCCEATIFYVGSRLFLSNELSLDRIILVFSSIVFSASGLVVVSTIPPELAKIRVACDHLLEVIALKRREEDDESKMDAKDDIKGAIEFKQVRFAYPSRSGVPILVNVDLKVNPKETIAIVGASGAGKSTMFQLLERFYKPSGGSIYVDGINIRKYKLDQLRKIIALVTQSPCLFNRTIAENIKYGTKNVTQAQIEEAAKQANIHDMISEMPRGYDTVVGDKGIQLSGGQRQRIAIARALLRQPKILLLDEFTSALDNESEQKIQASIDKIKRTRTIIIIAHRLATIKSADKIALMKDGMVIEFGSHKDLVAQRGYYHELIQSIKK